MTRERSSCNVYKLLPSFCRRQIPLFALSALLMVVFVPVQMLLFLQSNMRYWADTKEYPIEYVHSYIRSQLNAGVSASIMLIFLAVVAGMTVFHYLHSKNQTDFYHALPLRRGQLFFLNTMTGILAVIPMYLIGMLLSCGVIGVYGYGDAILWKRLLLSIAVHIIGFLLVYAVTVLSAVLCGNTLVALFGCAWLQFGVMVGYWWIVLLLRILYPAWIYSDGMANKLSAPARMLDRCNAFGEGYYSRVFSGLTAQEMLHAAVIPALVDLLFAILIFGIAYLLYRVRKSEKSGQSMAFSLTELPFKLIMTLVLSVGSAQVFYSIVDSCAIMFAGMAVCGLIISCIIEIIYDMDFRSLFRRWKSTLIFGVFCAVICGCMAMDVTGYNTKLPDREEIVSGRMNSYMNTWAVGQWDYNFNILQKNSADSEEYKNDIDLHEEANIDILYQMAQYGAEGMRTYGIHVTDSSYYEYGCESYEMYFTLKNGKTFARRYYADCYRGFDGKYANDTAVEENEIFEWAAQIRISPEHFERFSAASAAERYKDQIAMLVPFGQRDVGTASSAEITETDKIQMILETLKTEASQMTREQLETMAPVVMLRACNDEMKARAEEYKDTSYRRWYQYSDIAYDDPCAVVHIPVYACETETLRLLERYSGFVPQMNPEDVRILTETRYDEETGMNESWDYMGDSAQEAIAGWFERIVPSEFIDYMDPIYKTGNDTVTIIWNNGVSQEFVVSERAETENTDWKAVG